MNTRVLSFGIGGNSSRFLLLALALLSVVSLGSAIDLAAAPGPLANPNLQLLSNGSVRAAERLPDGSLVFGGGFSSVNGVPRSNIAKLKPDGTLDPDWNPSADADVYAIAVDAGSNVFVGGNFSTIGGQSRNRIAKLSGSGVGEADSIWNPNASSSVVSLDLDDSGNVYAGGFFSSIGGQTRSRIAKLSGSGTGAADVVWNPSANESVWALAVDGSGNVFAGGYFTAIGGQSRGRIAKLSGSGVGAADASWASSANAPVLSLALDTISNIYAGGQFYEIGGQNRSHIAKLSGSGTGAVDASWNPSANGSVEAIAIDASNNVYVGGGFSGIGGQLHVGVARISGSGTGVADPSWNPEMAGQVLDFALNPDGSVYAGGVFNSIGTDYRLSLVKLSSAGLPGAATDAEARIFDVRAIAIQPGGGAIIGGSFLKANGLTRANILRLRADGTLDPDWNASTNAYGAIEALATDEAGNVYAGGRFDRIGGLSRSYIAKLSGAGVGAVDPDWNPSANGTVSALATDTSGNVYVGGDFWLIGGQNRTNLAKLSGSGFGTVDPVWNPIADGPVYALAIDGGGNMFVGGRFNTMGGQSRKNVAKVSTSGTGATDGSWNPSPNGDVYSLALDGMGNLFAGGQFTTMSGQPHTYIAKISGSGSGEADSVWDPLTNGPIFSLAADNSGNLYVGGGFTTLGGQNRSRIAKLSAIGTGDSDTSWNPSANGYVMALAQDAANNIYAGGSFTSIGGQARYGLAALPPASTEQLAVTIADAQSYVQYGVLNTYTIGIGNVSSSTVTSAGVSDLLPPELDVATATWQCMPNNGATCTAEGTGNLIDEIYLPAGSDVVYVLSAYVVEGSSDWLENTVDVSIGSDTVSATDLTEIVILRSGFDPGSGGEFAVKSALKD